MIKVVGNQRRICCDNCRKPVGLATIRIEDRLMDPGAGYVTGVGKNSGITICGAHPHSGPIIEHPVACSDACEDRLLETWPRVSAENVYSEEWGEDFRDKDVKGRRR
jgi:hypothetical protein